MARTLAAKHSLISNCVIHSDRKRFVADRVPLVKLASGEGFILAAGKSVCTTFGKASFVVLNHVIDAVKTTPCARVLTSRELIYICVYKVRFGGERATIFIGATVLHPVQRQASTSP